jgi:hypothetical protein
VIYTLAGCRPGEACVIERTEQGFATREEETSAANDWLPSRSPWEARVCSDYLLTRSFAEAGEGSRNRRQALARWPGNFAGESFGWVAPPVLNPFTRIAVEMCPANGVLRALGYERPPDCELAQPVTATRELIAAAA